MNRKKILWVGEATYLQTGYAILGREILRRLQATGKYEIAEFATYGSYQDGRWTEIPWGFFPNMPDHPSQVADYERSPTHQWGEWRFEDVLLRFQPDVACDVRDFWMCVQEGTTIQTWEGIKAVEDIVPGDAVLTHRGRYRAVTAVQPPRLHRGTFYRLVTSGGGEVVLTNNHPVYVWRQPSGEQSGEWTWVLPPDLGPGDGVLLPLPEGEENPCAGWLAEVVGYFLAGGKTRGKTIFFTLRGPRGHSSAGQLLGLLDRHRPGCMRGLVEVDGVFRLRVEDAWLARRLARLVPGNVLSGRLFQSRPMIQDRFLRAYLQGALRRGGRVVVGSAVLAQQLFQMSLRAGLALTLRDHPLRRGEKNTPRHHLIFSRSAVHRTTLDLYLAGVAAPTAPTALVSSLEKVETFEGEHRVYNFEVEEDHSYCSHFVLHNCEYQGRSPFRDHFRWLLMAPCDGSPQNPQWLATYREADAVLTYTDWGQEELRRQSGGRIPLVGVAPPGADLDVFHPLPTAVTRQAHQQAMGLPEGCLVVGMVARNQQRKLFPDLFEAFRLFLDKAPTDLAQRSYLYLHTCHPDLGWNLPWFLNHFGVGHRVFFSYVCKHCRVFTPSLYQDARAVCRRCGQYALFMPTSQEGVSDALLCQIYQLFDLYVQLATNEGFGMPAVEAAACGVPVLATDYSAMHDVVQKARGTPIQVLRLIWENTTGRQIAVPDLTDLARRLTELLLLPAEVRYRMGMQAREGVRRHYHYDLSAQVWEQALDRLPPPERPWNAPARFPPADYASVQNSPVRCEQDWVDEALVRVLGRPDLIGSYFSQRLARDLQWKISQQQPCPIPFNDLSGLGGITRHEAFDRSRALDILRKMVEKARHWEQERLHRLRVPR